MDLIFSTENLATDLQLLNIVVNIIPRQSMETTSGRI
jgi:hypothetical protein